MPIKLFDSSADGIAGLEARINAWMETLEAGAVRYISTAAPPGGQPDRRHHLVHGSQG
jgi:hypothetical protein